MGIRGLNTFIKKQVPECIQVKPYMKYRNTSIGIDANILLYKYCYMYPNDIVSFLLCFVYKIISLLRFGILPIFIFDGRPPHEKRHVIYKRSMLKKQISERLQRLKSLPNKTESIRQQILMLERKNFMVTKEHRQSVFALIELMGIPVFTATNEAENLCATLQKQGVIQYTMSDDTDTYVFGCVKVLKVLKHNDTSFLEIDTDTMLTKLEMSRDQFMNMCILSGCDYTEHVSNIPIQQCYNVAKKYETIEECITELKESHVHLPPTFNHERIKSIYMTNDDTMCDVVRERQTLNPFNEKQFVHMLHKVHKVPLIEVNRFVFNVHKALREFEIIRTPF